MPFSTSSTKGSIVDVASSASNTGATFFTRQVRIARAHHDNLQESEEVQSFANAPYKGIKQTRSAQEFLKSEAAHLKKIAEATKTQYCEAMTGLLHKDVSERLRAITEPWISEMARSVVYHNSHARPKW
jgi:hypothetical protein